MKKSREELRKMSLKQLENHLEQVRSLHLSAWNTYGSELSSGHMERVEEIIREIIREKKE